jgi:signal transduction histidine kinase/CheY-like chemotaxis protein
MTRETAREAMSFDAANVGGRPGPKCRRRFAGKSAVSMRRAFAAVLTAALAVPWSAPTPAAPLDVSTDPGGAIGEHVFFLAEESGPLGLDDAVAAHGAGKFAASRNPVLNFGIGARPVWIAFEVANPGDAPVARRLSIETSWLDRIDVHFRRDGRTSRSLNLGDALPFSSRPLDHRFFVFDHAFAPGKTQVFIRVETRDPMVLPIFLNGMETARARETAQEFSYGLMYGYIAALLAYNFMLYLSMRGARYLYYSVYLTCFTIMNISYTGHGFRWLWPDSPTWQLWSNPVLMVVYAISGLLFATRFLNTRTHFPRLHRATVGAAATFGGLLALAIVFDGHAPALYLAFSFILLFTSAMILLGIMAVRARLPFAQYFLFAFLAAGGGATVTALAVWGFIPFSVWTYRAIDAGTLIDVTLLALAIAAQYRASENEKLLAKELARAVDSANRAKSEFLSVMSHELRTPLNVILGFCQLLLRDAKIPLNETQQGYVADILRAGQHLLKLINDALDLAKIESGRVSIFIENVSIASLFEDIFRAVGPLAVRSGIALDIPKPAADLAVRADETRIKQVLINLLSNALKYNRAGGRVAVRAEPTPDGLVRVSVADTGIGVPPERRADLFKPFRRLGAEATEIEGTGIGLALTKRLVEMMDGRIGVTSEVGVGSTFWFELPAGRADALDEAPAEIVMAEWEDAVPDVRGTVLYVEDNPANLKLMIAVAAQLPGLTLLTVHNAELGLTIAAARRPDAILMDINLPGMNGYDALKRLKADPGTQKIPVVALSADATRHGIEKGAKAGFFRYMTKPVDLEQLLKAVNEAIESARQHPSQ